LLPDPLPISVTVTSSVGKKSAGHRRNRTTMKKLTAFFVLGLTAVALTGCGKAAKADCEKAFDHIIEITIAPMKDLGEDAMKAARDGAAAGKEDFMKQCEGKVSKASVDCVIAAKSLEDITKCDNV
jgi:hypothetical protein